MIKNLSKYGKVVIQCHNNPDADTIASAYGLYLYFQHENVECSMIYCGNKIRKPNLILMVSKLNIPLVHLEDTNEHIEGMLVLIDCQYGESNVTRLSADHIAVIDHHNAKKLDSDVEYVNIQSQLGSCSTLVWKMLKDEGFLDHRNSVLETALYYGLLTDTENFVELHHPLDLDMRDDLLYDKMIISQFCNSNISKEELEVAGIALLRNEFNKAYRYSVCHSKPCDPNVMGLIIDLVKTVDSIDTCVVYNDCPGGYKFSVRSCTPNVRANDLAEYLVQGIGSSGGHNDKAGGFCSIDMFREREPGLEFESYLNARMASYFETVEEIRFNDFSLNKDEMKVYIKKDLVLGYVDPMEFLERDTDIIIRTLEGDVNCVIDGSFYIVIGALGEVYPILKDKFDNSYVKCNDPYDVEFEYDPVIITNSTGEKWDLCGYAKPCRVASRNMIYARQFDHFARVYTQWDYVNYMHGTPGDYLACRMDDENDIYIIKQTIFEKTYDLKEQDRG